jgi:nitroreductase
MIQKISQFLPKSLKRTLRYWITYPFFRFSLWRHYSYDKRRFRIWSSADGRPDRQLQLRSWINADYHKIEKALALRSPRPGFGMAVVGRLLSNLEEYLTLYGFDEICHIAINTLNAYLKFNETNDHPNPRLAAQVKALEDQTDPEILKGAGGGTIEVIREDVHKKSKIDLWDFFYSRHSIRQFSPEPVDRELIERAVKIAQKTPTVCNRQSPKVYAFDEATDRERVLTCQRGNGGFGHEIPLALVITLDVQTFFSVGERNQGWIDGGLFSMSLVYALHSLGLGTICLNWSVETAFDQELRKVAGISPSESIVMLIGVGHLPEKLTVAQSCRKPLNEVLSWPKTNRSPILPN